MNLAQVTVGYAVPKRPPRAVLKVLSLSIAHGELVCLLGPNGAGKSTLLRTMAGMQPPLGGVVTLNGASVQAMGPRDLARQLAVVLTERVTAGLLTVYDLVALGRYPFTDWTGKLTIRDHEVVQRAIRLVGAEPLAHRVVAELSDGERQKAMVARALAQEPSVMILDEVTAFLDLPRRVEIMGILKSLAHDHGCAILLSTHDLDLALHTADTLWVVNGTTIAAGMPEELVMAGTFEAAFASDGLWFDRTRGAFRFVHHGRGAIAVSGEGTAAVWTRRAVERRGFTVAEADATAVIHAQVEVSSHDGGARWAVERDGQRSSHESLRSALEQL